MEFWVCTKFHAYSISHRSKIQAPEINRFNKKNLEIIKMFASLICYLVCFHKSSVRK